jgi:hypothetical protein
VPPSTKRKAAPKALESVIQGGGVADRSISVTRGPSTVTVRMLQCISSFVPTRAFRQKILNIRYLCDGLATWRVLDQA